MISVNLLADAAVLETLVPLLEDEGATVSAHEFLFELQEDTVRNSDVLMVTSEFDQQKGRDVWLRLRRQNPQLLLIMLVDATQAQESIESFRVGAFDVLTLPVEVESLQVVMARASQFVKHRQRLLIQGGIEANPEQSNDPVAVSGAMKQTLNLLNQVADMELPVLLIGETGTGKSVLANYVHRIGRRRDSHFLTVNCGAIAPTLLESELFGHEKGAFTGAADRRIGLLEAADGGTLFLDEINSASPELQVRLLQFIQDKKLLRVGARTEVEVDVRLIVATNQPLKPLVDSGRFREDLYFRLNVFPVEIPPLRNRVEDISYLAARFLFKHAPRLGKKVNACGPGVLDTLRAYAWPGNVRELENVVQRALIMSHGHRVELSDLPVELLESTQLDEFDSDTCHLMFPENLSLQEVESYWIKQTLHKYKGNKLRASKQLGIDPSTLWRKLKGKVSK